MLLNVSNGYPLRFFRISRFGLGFARNRLTSTLVHSSQNTQDRKPIELQDAQITDYEFGTAFNSCRPLKVWPDKIAVAFSGGADSTCLLYLLRRLISQPDLKLGARPREVIALTVDHALQPMSGSFAQHCKDLAESLEIKHLTIRIPWGKLPYPPNPVALGSAKPDVSGEQASKHPFETVARLARYHALFDALQDLDINVIAMGHHADDQVETALLRIAMGSSEVGAGGMRSSRRWGMGLEPALGPGRLGWAGLPGMNMWIVRPLLQFSKDRILSTCRVNGLEYIDDPTNFQPDITPRNSIRFSLDNLEGTTLFGDSENSTIAEAEALINLAGLSFSPDGDEASLHSSASPTMEVTRKEQLRAAVRTLYQHRVQIDREVTGFLKRALVPSPISTLVLPVPSLHTIKDPAVRTGLILRALRYVSPFPWGSPRAEAGRRASSLKLIMEKIWGMPASSNASRKSFIAGGGVLWYPVTVTRAGELKSREPREDRLPFERAAWLLTRQSPQRAVGGSDARAGPDTLSEVDLTEPVQTWVRDADKLDKSDAQTGVNKGRTYPNNTAAIEMLFDCRFLVRMIPSLLPRSVLDSVVPNHDMESSPAQTSSIVIVSHSQYSLPRVVWRSCESTRAGECVEEYELARLLPSGTVVYGVVTSRSSAGSNLVDGEDNSKHSTNSELISNARVHKILIPAGAIEIHWIRSLDADGSEPERGDTTRVKASRSARGGYRV